MARAITNSRRAHRWTAAEDALVGDENVTIHELIERLGGVRTLNAVRRRRQLLREGLTAETRAWGIDPQLLNRPARACSSCGREFAPTLRRRILCAGCYSGGDGGMAA